MAWTRVRFYDSEGCEERLIDLTLTPGDERAGDVYETIMADRRNYPLERAAQRLERGMFTSNDLPHWGRPYSPHISTHDGDDYWIGNGGILIRIDREGRIQQGCDLGPSVPGTCIDVALAGDRIALCFMDNLNGNGIAVGALQTAAGSGLRIEPR